MPTTDTTLVRAAMEFSGSFLYAVTAAIILIGVLVVAFSFRETAPVASRQGSECEPRA